MQQTLSHPFWAEQHESVGAIFWRVILRCGVLAGLACSFLLWGTTQALTFAASVLLGTVYAALVGRLFHPEWRITWSVRVGVRVASYLTAAGAVITVADEAGLLLVVLCLVLTPSVRSGSRDAAAWVVGRLRAPQPH